jgi:hypothetical protein
MGPWFAGDKAVFEQPVPPKALRAKIQRLIQTDDPKRLRKYYQLMPHHPFLAKRNTEHGSGTGRWRWVVKRTFAWLNHIRGPKYRESMHCGQS